MEQREVVLYTRKRSLRCWRAKRLLVQRGYDVKVIDTTSDGSLALLTQFAAVADRKIVLPYVFIDHRPVGGWSDIRTLDRSGALELLVRVKV